MLEELVVIGKGRTEPNKDWSQEDPHYKNGDSILCNNDLFLYAVADGTSSFSTASEASSTAINILEEKFQEDKDNRFSNKGVVLRDSMKKIHTSLYERGMKSVPEYKLKRVYGYSLTPYPTTFTGAVISQEDDKTKLYSGNFGDSQIFLFRQDELFGLAKDHPYMKAGIALGAGTWKSHVWDICLEVTNPLLSKYGVKTRNEEERIAKAKDIILKWQAFLGEGRYSDPTNIPSHIVKNIYDDIASPTGRIPMFRGMSWSDNDYVRNTFQRFDEEELTDLFNGLLIRLGNDSRRYWGLELQPNDLILIASDGLYRFLPNSPESYELLPTFKSDLQSFFEGNKDIYDRLDTTLDKLFNNTYQHKFQDDKSGVLVYFGPNQI